MLGFRGGCTQYRTTKVQGDSLAITDEVKILAANWLVNSNKQNRPIKSIRTLNSRFLLCLNLFTLKFDHRVLPEKNV